MILILALLVAVLYWPSSEVLFQQWSDFVNITFTHGWLIVAVCVALVVRERRQIVAAPASPWPLAMGALVIASAAWLVCYRASIQDLHITIFPALFWLAVASAFGWPVARLLLFPVAFFVFALPSWAQWATPLQDLTVLAMHAFLSLTGPHAVIDGPVIHLPNGSFAIEEGCSGLHFMVVGLAVAALHGELRRDRWRTRLEQLALMAVLALLANWVRVYVVIEAGYLTDMHHYLVSVSHYWFGWAVFAVALVAFFWLSTWLTRSAARAPLAPSAAAPAPATGSSAVGFMLAAVLLALGPGLSALVRHYHPPAPLNSTEFVTVTPPWAASPPAAESFWLPDFAGADDTEYLQLTGGAARRVEVFRVRFRTQRQGAELVGESSSLLGQHLRSRGEQLVATPQGKFHETIAADPTDAHSLLWWRYDIGGRHFVRPLASQLWYGTNAVVWNPPAALLAFRAECRGDCEDARRLLRELLTNAQLR